MMVRTGVGYRDLDFFTLNDLAYMNNVAIQRDKVKASLLFKVGQKVTEAILVASPVIKDKHLINGEKFLPDPYFYGSKELQKPIKTTVKNGKDLLKLWGIKL